MSSTRKQQLAKARQLYMDQLDNQSSGSESEEESEQNDQSEEEKVPEAPPKLKRSGLQSPRKQSKDSHSRVDFEDLATKVNKMMKIYEEKEAAPAVVAKPFNKFSNIF